MSGDWNPSEKYQLYLEKIQDILGEEQRSVRSVYYALEARGFPDELARYGHEFGYRFVKKAVRDGRRAGYIDPELIVDTSRPTSVYARSSHSSPESFLRSKVRQIKHGYFENYWDDQQAHVEVWLEKASLEPVFRPICDDWNVRLEPTKGDWSDSKVYEAAQRLRDHIRDGKDVRIEYFGDFNPSGMHAPVTIQQRMRFYGIDIGRPLDTDDESTYFDIWPYQNAAQFDAGGSLLFTRQAVTLNDIRRFDLPENPTPSSTDKDRTLLDRFMTHVSDGRDVNIELDALSEYHRDHLEYVIENAITRHIDTTRKRAIEHDVVRKQEYLADAISVEYDGLPE